MYSLPSISRGVVYKTTPLVLYFPKGDRVVGCCAHNHRDSILVKNGGSHNLVVDRGTLPVR